VKSATLTGEFFAGSGLAGLCGWDHFTIVKVQYIEITVITENTHELTDIMDQRKFESRLRDVNRTAADPYGRAEGNEARHLGGRFNFNLKPEELEAYLNEYVVDQPEAVEVIATKICTHFNRMRLEMEQGVPSDATLGNIKSNILMIGPTGVGKTYIIKLIAEKLGVPFVKGDATKFSETGYVGGDVDDLVRDLVREADGDITAAEYGIIYIDEIDKIASSPGTWGPDVSRTGVQRNLLKLMEETEVDMKVPHDLASQMEAVMQAQRTGKAERKRVNTRNILFVVSGAFDGISERIAKRLAKNPIGFKGDIGRSSREETHLLRQITTKDLLDFGFESEFIGRLPVTVVLNDLNEASLYRILDNPNCAVIRAKKREFESYGIELEFEDEALRLLSQQAANERTGARGLLSAIERVLIKFEKRLPTVGVRRLSVSRRLMEEPREVMSEIVFEHTLEAYARDFRDSSGVRLTYHPDVRQNLLASFVLNEDSLDAILRHNLKDYVYGVKLLGISEFEVTPEVMADPAAVLDRLIKEAYEYKMRTEAGL